MALDTTPLPLTWLRYTWALVHVGDYVQIMCALAPNTLATPLTKTIVAFCHLHPLAKVDLHPFVDNFHLETNLILDREAFIYALTCFPRLSSSGPSAMVYELLQDCFVPNDFVSGFNFFLKYLGTLFVVMLFHQYHICLLHHNYWLWKNKLKAFNPL